LDHRLIDGVEHEDVLQVYVAVPMGERAAVNERRITAAFGVHQEPDRGARPFQRLGRHMVLQHVKNTPLRRHIIIGVFRK